MKQLPYRTALDEETGINITYYIETRPEERQVRWKFYPHLPKGICAKKGDETGLGSMHDDSQQSYEDFLQSPHHELPPDVYRGVVKIMGKQK